MIEFANNNIKSISIEYMAFEFNYKYHLCVFYKENIELYSWSKQLIS